MWSISAGWATSPVGYYGPAESPDYRDIAIGAAAHKAVPCDYDAVVWPWLDLAVHL